MRRSQTHTINTDLVQWFFRKGRQNLLYSYSVSSFIMGSLGYMERSEWVSKVSKFCSVSDKTAYRWLKEMLKFQLLKEKKGVLYIKGKKALMGELNISTKNAISLDESELKNKTNYKKLLVEQLGLLYQNRYRYAHKDIVRHSSNMKGRIENRYGIARNSYDVGCSLSYLSLKTGLSKTQVSRCLSSTRKVTRTNEVLFIREFKAKYDNAYFKGHRHLAYSYSNGRFYIVEKLPSVLEASSKLKRSKL